MKREHAAAATASRFSIATADDDAEIRRLLRDNPMPGAIRIALQREPDSFRAAAIEGDEHYTIIARDNHEWIIAMGSISMRRRFINGRPARVGYLGQLRLDERISPRAGVILGGYQFFHQLHERLDVKLYLTSIAADNHAARRLLERGLPGMPTYRPVCEFVTLIYRRPSNLRCDSFIVRRGTPELMPVVAALINASAEAAQFAPSWTDQQIESLAAHGLRPEHFRVLFEKDRAIACAAVWDQRPSRQAVVRRYPPLLRWARVPLNLLSPLTNLPPLPPVGTPIPLGLVSHLATPTDRPELIVPLVNALNEPARALGLSSLAVGFDARDPRLAILRKLFGGREYRTILYAVHWEDGRAAAGALDDRLCQPEVALL